LTAAVLSVGLVAGSASADDKDQGPLRLELFQIGLGSLAGWIRGAGKPKQKGDEGQFGLYLQKNTKTANFSSAGGDFTGNVPKTATDLHTLAFDIPGVVGVGFKNFDPTKIGTGPNGAGANGYCNNGSRRFNVFSFNGPPLPDFSNSVGTCFLGCASGAKTQDTVTGWWQIKFTEPFTQYAGCSVAPSGNIIVEVILDEGIDVGVTVGDIPGNVVLDNLRVNDKLIGKPTD